MHFTDYLRKTGYKPFHGAVDAAVYADFGCQTPYKAVWYHKRGSFQCAGCKQQCETDSPRGFQLFLEIAP